jgi:hypothetical protein
MPAVIVAGTPLYLKFCTKIVAVGPEAAPLLDEFEHEAVELTSASPTRSTGHFQPRRIVGTIIPPLAETFRLRMAQRWAGGTGSGNLHERTVTEPDRAGRAAAGLHVRAVMRM